MEDRIEINNMVSDIKVELRNLIDRPKEMIEFINSILKPKEVEKKEFGEVYTPLPLVEEMVGKLDESYKEKHGKSIFSEPHLKWFDPCVGVGNFMTVVYYKLMDGLKGEIKSKMKRKKHILENMLYMSEIGRKNVEITRLVFNGEKYKLNLYQGDTLKLDTKEEWGVEKFDVVLGNPPYNENPDNSKDPHMKPVYQDWIYKLNELSQMLLFITPSKWFSSSDKLLVELRDYMKLCNIEFIIHYPQDDVFKNVKIKGGVSYYLINKPFEGKTLFNNSLIDINKYDILVEPKYYNLLTKIHKYNSKNLSELYCSQGTFLNSKTEKELTSTGDVLCYVSKKKGFKKYISKEKINKNFDYWKVITPAAAYKGTSGFSNIYILNDNEIHSRSYISFKVKSKQESESLYSYLKCKLVQILLSLRKQTHNLSNSNNFIWIPLVPLNQEWNNDKLYEYFELDKNDIIMIKDLKLDGSYTK